MTTEGTTETTQTSTLPTAGNFSSEEVEFKEVYANASGETQQMYSQSCGVDNIETEMRKLRTYTNMASNQFWANGKINWNFVSMGDDYEKYSVYKDVNLGLTKFGPDSTINLLNIALY